MARHDLTDWIIHFVHDRNYVNDPLEFYNLDTLDNIPVPDRFTDKGEEVFLTDEYREKEYGLDLEANAFCVLKKILHDGYIRTGWSFRNGKPTIYGPRSVVCFTEMPLYGLIEYAKKRNNTELAEQYGIAFFRNELYTAGARPVIYGLSGQHKEATKGDPHFGVGLRVLSSECGLGLKEMYRYVYTHLGAYKKIDWTHEREWRWADLNENFDFPGMPVFAQNEKFGFSKIIVIVKTHTESEEMIEHLKNLYHSASNEYAQEYDLDLVQNTYVLALDELIKITKETSLVKLDDLPLTSIPKIKKVNVSHEILEKVKEAVKRASEISYEISKAHFDKYGDKDVCGWCDVVTYHSNSEITQALIDLELARTYSDGRYYINKIDTYPVQSLGVSEAGIIAAAKFLTDELGQDFWHKSTWD